MVQVAVLLELQIISFESHNFEPPILSWLKLSREEEALNEKRRHQAQIHLARPQKNPKLQLLGKVPVAKLLVYQQQQGEALLVVQQVRLF